MNRKTPRKLAEAILPKRLFASAQTKYRRFYWWHFGSPKPHRTRRAVKRLLKRQSPIHLELGSGPRPEMEGWTSLDWGSTAAIQIDLHEPLPFPDSSVEAIYSSHMLEHFTYPHPM